MGKRSVHGGSGGALVARTVAAGVVANASTGATMIAINQTLDGIINVDVNFTLGSLTNATFTPQVSDDGVNWSTLTDPGALGPLTATGRFSFPCIVKGRQFFRVAAASTGTPTSSSAAIAYTWQTQGGAN
jgi:hypothetical protein